MDPNYLYGKLAGVGSATVPERVGLAVVGAAGLLSTISTTTLLAYVLYCVFGSRRSPLTIGVRSFAKTPMGKYFISLLFADFVQGVAFSTNFHFVNKHGVVEGHICTAQGVMSQIGDLGTALWSFAIAVHTFWLLFLQRKPASWLTPTVLTVVWIFDLIMPIVGTLIIEKTERKGSFWGPSGAWCWISTEYEIQRMPYLYAWVFTALFFSIIIYILIYLKFTGVIDTDVQGRPIAPTIWSKDSRRPWSHTYPQPHVSANSEDSDGPGVSKHIAKVARRLMWYPIIYSIVVIPVSICRIGSLVGWDVPFGLYVFAGVCFASSGTSNSALFLFTRHAFIQNVMRPTGIRITTHQITVGDEQLAPRKTVVTFDGGSQHERTSASKSRGPRPSGEYIVKMDTLTSTDRGEEDMHRGKWGEITTSSETY